MKYITIIPARSGSKRLPGKNILPLGDKPLIAHSILYSQKEMPNVEIYVSTDGEEIATIATNYGAKIIKRPVELANDYVSSASALQHAVKELLLHGCQFDYIVLLQPTNPLRPSGLLQQAKLILETEQNYDSLITVSPLIKKMGKIQDDKFTPLNYQFGQRSQDIETIYYENGLLYISKKELILNGEIIGNAMYPMVVEHIYGTIDIDTKDDFYLADFYMRKYNE